MKTGSESASKSKGNGSARKSNGPNKSGASSANSECPREQMVAVAAYYNAERRGFAPENDLADWLQAEAEVESLLRSH